MAATVIHEATAGPVIDDDYRKIMQSRTKSAMDAINSRTVSVMSNKDSKLKGQVATSKGEFDALSRPGVCLFSIYIYNSNVP